MKKVLILCAFIGVCFGVHAYAAIGDVVSPIYSTDILTVVDGLPIRGYAIDRQTMIALEDLRDYGFTINYDDSIRTVFIDKTYEPTPEFLPQIERGRVGEISGYTLETDIKAYVNGKFIDTQAIDGKVVAVAEQLGTDAYGMSYSYDDSVRTLYLKTIPSTGFAFPEPDWGAIDAERRSMSSENELELYTEASIDNSPYYGAKFEPRGGAYIGMVTENSEPFSPVGGYLTYLDGMRELKLYHPADYMIADGNSIVTVAWNMTDTNINYSLADETLRTLNSYNKPMLIRFAGEMSEGELGEDPAEYVKMFRRFADMAHKYENLAVVWSPLDLGNLYHSYDYYYPGDEYVDWVGVSCYAIKYFSGEKDQSTEANESFFMTGDNAWATNRIKLFMKYLEDNNIKKPVMISECGVSTENQYGEDLEAWASPRLRNMLWSLVMKYPQIKLINYFNVKTDEKQTFYITDKPYASFIFRQAAENGMYIRSLDDTADFIFMRVKDTGGLTADNDGDVPIYTLTYINGEPTPAVSYSIDGVNVAERTEIPHKYDMKITGLKDGRHTLTVSSGNMSKNYIFIKSNNTVTFVDTAD